MKTGCRLELLGGFRLAAGEAELRLPTRKAEALLAYLALAPGKVHAREALIALLWGDRSETQARHSLSQTLFSIRRVAIDAGLSSPLVVDARGMMLEPASIEVDAQEFERLIAENTPKALERAAELYRGELLSGLRLREVGFEEWLTGERSRLREMAAAGLAGLLEHHSVEGRRTEAVQAAVRLLALDPLQEEVHRRLMRLYVAQGRPASALKQYELCARTLRQELAVEPEIKTRQLHDEIKLARAAKAPALLLEESARIGGRNGPPTAGRPSLAEAGPAGLEESATLALVRRPVAHEASDLLRSPRTVPAFGRTAELRRLRSSLDKALAGSRQILFVTGEAGLGKTTLVEAFLDEIETEDPTLSVGIGQCIEHSGPGEAYMPVLEAFGRLCRAPQHGRELIALLAQEAPSWLIQMPGLLDAPAFEEVQKRAQRATRERMLREMVEAMEGMTAISPLVLVLEDLHWSDPSTIDMLAALVRRREPARLLVIGTYRPAEVRADGHPLHALVQELCGRGLCEELAVTLLSREAVEACLDARFGPAAFPPDLARLVHQRTDGNPLFVAGLANSWVAEGLLVPSDGGWSLWATPEELTGGIPSSLRQLIERQVDRLSADDQAILEAASVAGREVSAAIVAAALDRDEDEDEDETEARCTALARQGRIIHARGITEWPDGTVTSRYGFIHDLYQEVLYDRVPVGRRARLHRRCGLRLEAAYGSRIRERAGELAFHALRGRDFERAVGHLALAAEQAFERGASAEAIAHLDTALDALRHLPDADERVKREISLQTRLGEILTATEGWASAKAERALNRARELCRQVGNEPPELPRVLYGLANLYEFRGEFGTSSALIEERLRLPGDIDDGPFLEAQELLTCSLYHRGRFADTLSEAARGIERYHPEKPGLSMAAGDMAAHLQAWAAMALWFLGHPDQAHARALDVVELGRRLDFPAAVAAAYAKGSIVQQLRRDAALAESWASAALKISIDQGFRYRAATASIFRGWARATQGDPAEGIGLIQEGLASLRQAGAEMDRPHYLALLAEAYGHAGRLQEGLEAVEEGLVILRAARGGQPFFYESELHRLKGVLLSRLRTPKAEAEASLHRALDVASGQNALALQLRAAMSLLRHRPSTAARKVLRDLHGRFTDGLETPDLIEAKALLAG